jgi:hypothetical protein
MLIGVDTKHGVSRGDLFKLHQRRPPIHWDVRASSWRDLQVPTQDWRASARINFLEAHCFTAAMTKDRLPPGGPHVGRQRGAGWSIPLIEAQGRKGRPATAPADRGNQRGSIFRAIAAAVSPAEGPFVRFKVSEEGRGALMLGLKIDA